MDILRSKSVSRRSTGRLANLLDKLTNEFFDGLSPIDDGSGLDLSRSFNPSSLASVSADRDWFVSMVRRAVTASASKSGGSSGEVCARLLSSLDHEEILELAKIKDFNLEILSHALKLGDGSKNAELYVLFEAAKEALFQHVEGLVEDLPRPFQAYRPDDEWQASSAESRYAHMLEASFFESPVFRHSLLHLMSAFAEYADSDSSAWPDRDATGGGAAVLTGKRLGSVVRFATLSLEYLKWISCYAEAFPAKESHLEGCLRVVGAAMSFPEVAASFVAPSAENNGPSGTPVYSTSASLCLHAFYKYVLKMPGT